MDLKPEIQLLERLPEVVEKRLSRVSTPTSTVMTPTISTLRAGETLPSSESSETGGCVFDDLREAGLPAFFAGEIPDVRAPLCLLEVVVFLLDERLAVKKFGMAE